MAPFRHGCRFRLSPRVLSFLNALMFRVRSRHASTLLLLNAFTVAIGTAVGQTPSGRPAAAASRAQLMERLRAADSLGRREEAFLLRTRLRDGDFEVGDVMIANYEGAGLTRRDSLVVEAGKVLHLLAPLGDLSLEGVLRFEAQDSISARVAKYFKNEAVRVTPLIRISVSGAAKAPGFMHVRLDQPLSDVLMRGGGLVPAAAGAPPNRIDIMRGDKVLWDNAAVATALTDGLTLEQLDLQAGDDILVTAVQPTQWKTVLQYVLPVFTILIYFIPRRR